MGDGILVAGAAVSASALTLLGNTIYMGIRLGNWKGTIETQLEALDKKYDNISERIDSIDGTTKDILKIMAGKGG